MDEGYKTLSARNLVLFGDTHWHDGDDYSGWHRNSPLTSWSYVGAFRLGSAELSTARSVTIIYYTLFLMLFAVAMRKRYSPGTLAGGVAVLSGCAALFFFSRLALIEAPMILLLYGWVFALARMKEKAYLMPLLSALLVGVALAQGVKLSALVYLIPVIVAMFSSLIFGNGFRTSARVNLFGLVAVVGVGIVLYLERDVWIKRIDLGPLGYLANVLDNPLIGFAPFLFLIGWVCASHLLLGDFRATVSSPYRLALVSMVLGGTLLMGVFEYNPPRYYVPLLPAYVLIGCEWLSAKGWRVRWFPSSRFGAGAAVLLLAVSAFSVAQVANVFLLKTLPLAIGQEPGLGNSVMLKVFFPLSLCFAGCAWWGRDRWVNGRRIAGVVLVAAVFLPVHSVVRIGSFVSEPEFDGRSTRSLLENAVPEGKSVIGDWAPFFALGTQVRAMYMSDLFNTADRLPVLRPDYFLFSDREVSRQSLEVIRGLEGVDLGEPIFESTYNNTQVVLYPLLYSN
ncbi:hypothetical protein [Pelagicoccus sp. SDUM812002]|uniref:hypothetical protein n=1 Tax=Pelagicoccus sp. SDUM812002 TaxID=3041266 RepID=UPI00280EC43F|nr:hypothetical protein [Pelagicoccus sp. SDUM812002]MDQ8186839.1 hypothetical protein [Pelagicoccus sp. SDUM812002]